MLFSEGYLFRPGMLWLTLKIWKLTEITENRLGVVRETLTFRDFVPDL